MFYFLILKEMKGQRFTDSKPLESFEEKAYWFFSFGERTHLSNIVGEGHTYINTHTQLRLRSKTTANKSQSVK